MSPTGGAVTVDYDGKGRSGSSSPDGALRFNPATETFTEFKSVTYKTPNGNGVTYGAAGDRNGNGWWAEMTARHHQQRRRQPAARIELKLPRREVDKDLINARGSQVLRNLQRSRTSMRRSRGAQGPRRMGTDKNADVLWVGNSWGNSLAKINTQTMDTSFVSLPGPGVMQPYHVAVDSRHNAWTQYLDVGCGVAIRPGRRHVDHLRPSHARDRGAPHLAARK